MSKPSEDATPGRQPPRSGLRRLITPLSTATSAVSALGLLPAAVFGPPHAWCVPRVRRRRLAAFFLTISALNLAGGYWYLTIDATMTHVT